jgi:hypothetical protein
LDHTYTALTTAFLLVFKKNSIVVTAGENLSSYSFFLLSFLLQIIMIFNLALMLPHRSQPTTTDDDNDNGTDNNLLGISKNLIHKFCV